MTRMLAELLGVRELDFRATVAQLERASGDPGADIRLSSDILQRTQDKIRDLGLDPHDTAGAELYSLLLERLKSDEARVRAQLGLSDTAEALQDRLTIKKYIDGLNIPRGCFALKSSVAKRLLKKITPKEAMQALGYRSIDSFLKHEPVALIYAAAWDLESAQWRHTFVAQYAKLQPSDFEPRDIELIVPTVSRWQQLGSEVAGRLKQSSLYFKELGAVVLLPLPAAMPGQTLVSLLFTLHNIDDIRSASAYLKLQQVRPNFGDVVTETVTGEPTIGTDVAGQPLSWRLVQHYFGLLRGNRAEVFEPHVQAEDLAWQYPETELVQALPVLDFWANTLDLALLDEQQPVSLNLFDVALSYCNKLPYGDRVVHYVQENIKHELLMRYMHEQPVEQTITGQLGNELLGELALA